MYFYWMEASNKSCPITNESCKGPECCIWRWETIFNDQVIENMPREGHDTVIKPHMIGYCGKGNRPVDDQLEPWNKSRSPGHFMPYNP